MRNPRLRLEAKTRKVRLERLLKELTEALRKVLAMDNAFRDGQLRPGFAREFRRRHGCPPYNKASRCNRRILHLPVLSPLTLRFLTRVTGLAWTWIQIAAM